MGASFGGVVFLDHFVSGDAISGLGFFTDSGGVVAGGTTEHTCFFSSILISMGSFGSAIALPLLFKFGAGRIIGVYSIVKSWVIVCCVPASLPEGGGLAFLHLAWAWFFGTVDVVMIAVDQMFQIILYVKD